MKNTATVPSYLVNNQGALYFSFWLQFRTMGSNLTAAMSAAVRMCACPQTNHRSQDTWLAISLGVLFVANGSNISTA